MRHRIDHKVQTGGFKVKILAPKHTNPVQVFKILPSKELVITGRNRPNGEMPVLIACRSFVKVTTVALPNGDEYDDSRIARKLPGSGIENSTTNAK